MYHNVSGPDQVIAMIEARPQQDWLFSSLAYHELLDRLAKVRFGAFDFDGTLHTAIQWPLLTSQLPQHLRDRDRGTKEWYTSQQRDGHDLIEADDADWWVGHLSHHNRAGMEGAWVGQVLDALVQSHIPLKRYQKAATQLPMRPGADRLLSLMERSAIISFGIECVIKAWLAHYDLQADVAASRVLFDEQGFPTGYHPNVLVGDNKRQAVQRWVRIHRVPESALLVTGDSPSDANMMLPYSFNVIVWPRTLDNAHDQQFRNTFFTETWDKATIVLFADTFLPLLHLLHEAKRLVA